MNATACKVLAAEVARLLTIVDTIAARSSMPGITKARVEPELARDVAELTAAIHRLDGSDDESFRVEFDPRVLSDALVSLVAACTTPTNGVTRAPRWENVENATRALGAFVDYGHAPAKPATLPEDVREFLTEMAGDGAAFPTDRTHAAKFLEKYSPTS